MKNSYAAITGAAEGLGRSFALACAQQGYHLVLIDLPHHKLHRLAHHIQQSFGVQVLVIEQDLCAPTAAENIAQQLADEQINLSLLVNNAGMGFSRPFQQLPESYLAKLVQLNIQSLTALTYQLLPLLQQNTGAIIINMSSLASYFHLPCKSIYAASKAYVRFFSQSLRVELKPQGIHVCVVCPGPVNTNENQFITQQQAGWLARHSSMQPHTVATLALRSAQAGKSVIIPGFINRMLLFCYGLLPRALTESMMYRSMHRLALQSANQTLA